ncbi:hypothetical protein HGRIS_008087 [Hohenbuehelia grisea]|uniref:Uncharacterized protein n=1 Tax=Hohenbuehelia grisea TaxID=104357 RepID=A0ABR3J6W5_9AGAR
MSPVLQLFGSTPSSVAITHYIASLAQRMPVPGADTPEIKSYPDAVYFNYYSLGVSLLFTPRNGYKPQTGLKRGELKDENLALDGVDVYNTPANKPETPHRSSTTSRPAELAFSSYANLPLSVDLTAEVKDKDGKVILRPPQVVISPETMGKDLVSCLGEPDRKGGGAGPSSGSIGIWCEWSKDGLMVEFGGDEARGPQAWERGKDAVWRVISLFPPKST